jgi:hypothetical protein
VDAGRRKRLIVIVAGALVVTLALAHLTMNSSFYRRGSLNKGYAQVEMGDAESRVLTLMGKPDRVVLPGQRKWWACESQACVKQYRYETVIMPELWVIGFNSQGKVVYREHNVF